MLTVKAIVLLIVGTGAVVTAVATAIWGPRARGRRRLARGSTRLEDHAIVTLTGTVRAIGELLVAPLSGRACVAYDARSRILHRGAGTTTTEVVECKLVPFELVTRDATLVVHGSTAEVVIPPTPMIPRKVDREGDFLVAQGQPRELVRTAGFDEIAICDGDRISVQGMVVVEVAETGSERGFRDVASTMRLVEYEGHPLTIGPPL